MSWCIVTETETNTRQAALLIVCVQGTWWHPQTRHSSRQHRMCWLACHTQPVVIEY